MSHTVMKIAGASALTVGLLTGASGIAQAAATETVAFLMPDHASTRYEEHDFPGFQAAMKKLCPDCKVLYQNADADVSKQQQSSDWAAETLSDAQVTYAASDVLHLHALREKLDSMLIRSGRSEFAAACFDFLPTRARLDLLGWEGDIFSHD